MVNPFAKYAPQGNGIGPDPYKQNEERRKEQAAALALEASNRAAAQAAQSNANSAASNANSQKATELAAKKFAVELAKEGLMIGPDGQIMKDPKGAVGKAIPNSPQRRAQIESILGVIEKARAKADDFLAVGLQGKRASEWPLIGPALGQNRATLDGMTDSIFGDIIQQQIATLSANNGGNGVSSLANNAKEGERIAASIANLSLDQDLPAYLDGLDRAEAYYKRQLDAMPVAPEQQNQDIASSVAEGNRYANDGTGIKTGNNGFDKYVTDEDRQRTGTLQALYENPKTTPQQLNAAASQLGLQPFAEEDLRVLFDAKTKGERVRLSPNPTGQRSLGQQFLGAVADSTAGAYGGAALDAATAGFSDELVGLAYGDRAGQLAQYGKEYARNESPWASLAGDITGGFAIGGPATAGVRYAGIKGAQAASPFAAKLANTFAGNVPRAAITASTAQGALTGAGQMNDNRTLGALIGGGAGLAGAYGGAKLASLPYSGAATNVVNPVRGMVGARKLPTLPALTPAQQLMNKSVSGNFDNAIAQMDEAQTFGLPMMLADADPALRSLAGSTVRKSPDARGMAEQSLIPRQRGQYDRLVGAVNRELGPTSNVPELSESLIQQARTAARPLYQAFEAEPSRMSENLQSLIQTPAGRGALNRARTIAANERRDPNTMGFELDAQGGTILTQNPSPITLDYVKRGIDDTLEPYRNPMTGRMELDEAGRAIENVRSNYVQEMDRLYPNTYGQARSAYAGPAGERGALIQGKDALGMTPDDMNFQRQNLSASQQAQYGLGYRSGMVEQAGKMRYAANPWETAYGTPQAQQKLTSLFPEGADRFGRQYGLESQMAETNRAVIGGSPTAERLISDANFDMGFLPTVAMDAATTGTPLMSAGRLGAKFAGGELGRIGAKKKADALAPILFNADPAQNSALIKELQKNIKVQKRGQGIFGNRARKLGAIAGGAPSVGFTLGLTE